MKPFLRVIDQLNRDSVRYVVVGGFAAVMHGNNRFTSDLDIVVDLETQNVLAAVKAMLSLGLEARLPVDPLQFADPGIRKSWVKDKNMRVFTFLDPKLPTFAVDFFAELPLKFDLLFENSIEMKIEESLCRICSVEHLIEMKQQAGRPQDKTDIEALKSLQGDDSDA